MDFLGSKLFSMLKNSMEYYSDRQTLLSRNISNLDVPGAQSQDLKKPDFGKMASSSGKLQMAATQAGHKTGGGVGAASAFKIITTQKDRENTPTKNNIVMEDEMMKVAQTTAKYQETTSIYKKMMEMMKIASGSRQS